MAISTFGQYDYTSYSGVAYPTIQLDTSKVEVLTISTTKVDETFGRRYIKGIQHNSYNMFQNYGASQNEVFNSNTHYHYVDNLSNGGCITGSNTRGTDLEVTSYQHKYVMLGNIKAYLSLITSSLPLGVICISKQKPQYISGFAPLESSYLYVGASSAGGNQYHSHTVTNGTVGGGTCGANYDVPTITMSKDSAQIDVNSYGPLGYGVANAFNNEIVARSELFLLESTTYYAAKDFTKTGTIYVQNKTQSLPAGYTDVTSTYSGLLRFADVVGDLLHMGGVETHSHPIYSGTEWLTSSSSRPYLTGHGAGSHMPPYTAVRLIQKS